MKRLMALMALAGGLCAQQVSAEGTFELRQGVSTSDDIYLEGSLSTGDVNYDQHRVTFLRVDILDPSNEVIDLYGQALGGSPDVQVWCPGRIPRPTPDEPYTVPTPDFSADFTSTFGELTSFTDVEDVQSIGTRPRDPRTYSLTGSSPTCGTAGAYTIRYASAGIDGSGQRYFDVRVRDTAASTLETGRVWADKYAFSMASPTATVGTELYVVAGEDRGSDYLGIVWLLDLNDVAPFGFQLYANERGVGPEQYNYKSVGSSASPPPEMDPQYPIYLNPPDKPVTTPGALGNIEAIETQCVAGGATDVIFRFETAGALPYTIRLDEDQDGEFDLDEVIATGTSVDGTNTVIWDGTLPGGGTISTGTNYDVELSLTTGEVHFPFYDVEDADPGPVITPVSISSSSTTERYYWDDTDPSITSSSGGGTTSGPNGTTSTHDWANGTDDYNDANMIDTWKYADVQSIQDVYQLPSSCAAEPEIGLAKDAAITADNGDGSVELTLDFRIENMGNIDLSDVQLSDDIADALPAPVSWSIDSVTTSANLTANGAFDGDADTNLLDASASTLPLGEVGLVSVVLSVDFNGETGPFTNTAAVAADDGSTSVSDDSNAGTDPDPDGDGDPSEDAPTPLPVAESDLEVDKTIDPATPYVGETVTWTVTVTNEGPVTETGAELTETLPAAFAVDTVTPSAGTWSSPVWTLPTLAPGQSETLEIAGSFTTDGNFINVAELTAATNPDPDSTPDNGQPGEDDQAESSAVVAPLADIAVSKSDGGASVVPGDTITYQLEVSNAGPSSVTGVELDDPTPAGLTLESVAAPCGSGFPCTLSEISAGGSMTVDVTFSVPPDYSGSDPISNTATVTSPVDDPDSGNDSATDTTPLAPAETDLAVDKTVDDAGPNVGDDVAFTIDVVNNGPSNATGVTVTDALPTGYSFVAASESQGSYDSGTGVWSVGALADGSSASLEITATVQSGGDYVNSASVTGDEFDPDGSNNDDDASVSPTPVADLAIGKTDGGASVVPGTNVNYTITVDNLGPSAADNVIVTDPTPAGLTLVSVSGPCGSLPCNLGTIAASDSAAFTVTFAVPPDYSGPSPISNTASVVSDAGDPDSGNDSATDTTPVAAPVADLAIAKDDGGASVTPGENATWQVSVQNLGPSDATNVVIAETPPPGTSFVSATAPCSGGFPCTVPTLAVGDTLVFDVTFEVPADFAGPGTIANTVDVASDTGDPDGANNSASDDASITAPSADLAVSKVVDEANPVVGSNIVFTIDVTNNGPSDATGVELTDLLPSGYAFDAAAPSQGSYDDGSGVWTVGTVASGDSATLAVTAEVLAGGDTLNVATVSASDASDPDPDNNQDDADTSPTASADVSVTKIVDNATPNVGEQVTFTVTVSNDGPSDATGVSVDDALPSGYSLDSVTPSQGSYTAPTWSVGNLADGASATLDIVATVEASGDYANTATGTATEDDPDPSNNEDTETTNPVDQADLSVSKDDGGASVIPGETVAYTIEVSNNGPSTATSVTLDDPTPTGLVFVSADGPCSGGFPCSLGDLADGASATVEVVFELPSDYSGPDPISNTASVSSPTDDPDGSNNDATDTTPVDASEADLAVVKSVSPEEPEVGDTVTFTIEVSNNGPADATGVVVNDPLPAGYTFQSASATEGSYSAPDWTVGGLADGDSATLTIEALVTDVDDYLNVATASGNETDPDPSNDSDEASIRRLVLDLTAVCIDDAAYVDYTVTPLGFTPGADPVDIEWITEDGNATVVETLTDEPLTGQLLWPGTVLDGGGNPTDWPGWDFVGGEWVEDNDGLRPDMLVRTSINPEDEGVVTYPAATPTCSANPPVADLAVTKDDGGAVASVGGSVDYTIEVTNNGPSAAENVTVEDLTPPGLVFNANAGACTTPFPCSLGTLAVDETVVIQATFDVPVDYSGPDPIVNTVTVGSDTQELDPSDNEATDSTPVAFDGQNPVIGLAKALSEVIPTTDGPTTIVFTFTVENLGNVPLSDVQVEDDLATTFASPAQFVVESVDAGATLAANPNYDGQSDIGLLDSSASTLAVGETATVTLELSLDLSATLERQFENTAVASGFGPIGQATQDDSNNGFSSDPDGDGDPQGPEEDSPTPVDLGSFQVWPVPVAGLPGLFLLALSLLVIGGWFSRCRAV